ncbi:MAG: FliH/SctL family protein [Granulosicoccus sp.]
MFRVLSEEEAAKAIKWKAPDFGSSASHIVHAREVVSPVALNAIPPEEQAQSPSVNSSDMSAPTSAPALQVAQAKESSTSTVSDALNNPSVDMLQTSYDDGFAQGYENGSKALRDTKVVELTRLLDSLTKNSPPVNEESLEEEIYGLSIDIARILLRREISTDADALARLVKAGLDQLPSNSQGAKQVYLHPLDAQLIQQELTELPETAFLIDETLARGESRIQSESSTVHTGLENWLSSMATQLGLQPSTDQVVASSDSAQV